MMKCVRSHKRPKSRPLFRSLLIGCMAAVAFCFPPKSGAEVTIIRTLPETGVNKAEANWKPPLQSPDAEAATATVRPKRFEGRLIIGGYGSGSADSVSIDDWSTDSQLTYSGSVGQEGLLNMQAQAFRNNGIDRFDQRYLGAVGYSSSAFSFNLNGSYDQNEAETIDGSSLQQEGQIAVNFSTAEDVRFPLSLNYSSTWDSQEYSSSGTDALDDRKEEDHSLSLASEIPLGPLELNLDGGFDIHHNRLSEVSSLGYGGTLAAKYPLTQTIGLYAGIAPNYSETEYQLDDRSSREAALANDAGFLFFFSENFEGEVLARRTDAWRSDPDFSTDELSHTSIWGGESRWTLRYPEELTSTAEYMLSREAGGSISQDLHGSSVWEQEEGLLRRAGVESRFLQSWGEESSGSDLTELTTVKWGGFVVLEPADTISIATDYTGSRSESTDLALQHDISSDFSHVPMEGFSYGFGGAYSYWEESSDVTSSYSGQGNLNLSPVFGYRRVDFRLSELFELEDDNNARNLLSKSSFSSSVPITEQVKLRYLFSWEWIDLAVSGAAEGSAFLHSAGFSLSGPRIPFTVKSSYLVGHGFRGVQHQVDTSVEVPLMKSFSLISELSYRYAETVSYETPFLFSTLAHYEF